MRRIAIGAMLLLCAGLVSAGEDAKPAVDGGALFKTKCVSCHGKDAKGNPNLAKMFKLADPAVMNLTATKKTDADLAKVVLAGRNKMPAFKGKLTDEEISAVIGYVRSLTPAPKAPDAAKKKG